MTSSLNIAAIVLVTLQMEKLIGYIGPLHHLTTIWFVTLSTMCLYEVRQGIPVPLRYNQLNHSRSPVTEKNRVRTVGLAEARSQSLPDNFFSSTLALSSFYIRLPSSCFRIRKIFYQSIACFSAHSSRFAYIFSSHQESDLFVILNDRIWQVFLFCHIALH